MSAAGLSDRDLCLGVIKALGWKINRDGPELLFLLPGPSRALLPLDFLLTPAGAFAVLEAMRERAMRPVMGWTTNAGPWTVQIFGPGLEDFTLASHVSLARAIAEAAYAALEATR